MNKDNITIQRSTHQDFHNIKQLMLIGLKNDPKAFSVNYEDYINNSDEWWNSYITPYIFSIKDKMFIAFDNNKPVGMIGVLYDYKSRRKHIATIVWFYTTEEYRGNGIGRMLLDKAIEDAQTQGMIKITLFVNSSQEKAQLIYEKYGFSANGRLEKELKVGDEYLDTLIMEKFIN